MRGITVAHGGTSESFPVPTVPEWPDQPPRHHHHRRFHRGWWWRLIGGRRSGHDSGRWPSHDYRRRCTRVWRRYLMPLGFAGLVTALLCVLFLPLIPGLGTAPGEGRGRSVAELWTARRLASRAAWQADRGDWKEALRQARLAVLQRPGSAEANRVLLACLRHEASQRVSLDPREVHAAASRLLASSANRTEDTRLAMAAAMDVCDYTWVTDRLLPGLESLEVSLQGVLLDAQVAAGRFLDQPRQGAVHHLLAQSNLHESLGIYRTARAAAGDTLAAEAARAALLDAGIAGSYSRVATRLVLQVAAARQDVMSAREALFRLGNHGDDLLRDHLDYWGVLIQERRSDEVRQLVRNRPRPARTTDELVACLQLMGDLGLHGEALTLLREGSTGGIEDGRGILTCLQTWCRAGRRTDLRMLESHLGGAGLNRATASLLDHLLLALVAQNEGRREDANLSFQHLLEAAPTHPLTAERIARALLSIQEPGMAELVAQRIEWDLRDSPAYWGLRQEIAFRNRNPTAFALASRRALELTPEDACARANLVWSEVIEREGPSEPLPEILEQLALHPARARRELGQALAAAWYGDGTATAAALARLPLEQLESPDCELARFARCESLLAESRLPEALNVAAAIKQEDLFPAQRHWLCRSLAALPASNSVAGNLSGAVVPQP